MGSIMEPAEGSVNAIVRTIRAFSSLNDRVGIHIENNSNIFSPTPPPPSSPHEAAVDASSMERDYHSDHERLHWAARKGLVELCREFLHEPDVASTSTLLSTLDSKHLMPLHCAAAHGHVNVVMMLLDEFNADVNATSTPTSFTALHAACICGHLPTVHALVSRGANIESRDDKGCTPLLIAVQNNHIVIVHYLFSCSADLHVVDSRGANVCAWAVYECNVHMLKYVISAGADANMADYHGYTPLHWVALTQGWVHVAEMLIEHGCVDSLVCALDGKTAYDYAVNRGHWLLSVYLNLQRTSSHPVPADSIYEMRERRIIMIFQILPSFLTFICLFLLRNVRVTVSLPVTMFIYFIVLARLALRSSLVNLFGPGPDGNTRNPCIGTLFLASAVVDVYMYFFDFLPFTLNRYPTLSLLVVSSSICMGLLYLELGICDPGYLPIADLYTELCRHTSSIISTGTMLPLCSICGIMKPRRSKHCATCNRCVRIMDHHSLWINNCAAHRRYRVFFVTACLFLVACCGWIFLAFRVLPLLTDQNRRWTSRESLSRHAFFKFFSAIVDRPDLVVWIIANVLGGVVILTLIVGLALYSGSKNLTMNELFNWQRYGYLVDPLTGRYANQYNKGIIRNLIQVFITGRPHQDKFD